MRQLIPSKRFLVLSGLLVLAAASLGLLTFGQRGLIELVQLRSECRALERGNAELRAGNLALSGRIATLRDDPQAIERLARERLGMVKEGEVVYYLPRTGARGPAPLSPTPESE